MPASSMITRVSGPIAAASGSWWLMAHTSLARLSATVSFAELGAELFGCGRGGCEADDGAAAVGPGGGEGAHGGGLAGPGRRDRELEAPPGGGHVADQELLAGVEGFAVGHRLEQGEGDRVVVGDPAAEAAGGVDEAAFGPQDPPARCSGWRRACHTPRWRRGGGAGRVRPASPRVVRIGTDGSQVEGLLDDPVDHVGDLVEGDGGGPDLPEGFGADVPRLSRTTGRPRPTVSTRWAVWAIHASSTTGGATLGWLHDRVEQLVDAAAAKDLCGFGGPGGALVGLGAGLVFALVGCRGWPVGPVRASRSGSGDVRGRPRTGPPVRWCAAVIRCRRDDQRAFSRGSTPAISYTGRFPSLARPAPWSGRGRGGGR